MTTTTTSASRACRADLSRPRTRTKRVKCCVCVLVLAAGRYQFDSGADLCIESQLLFDKTSGDASIAFALESQSELEQLQDEVHVLTQERFLHYLAHCVPWRSTRFPRSDEA